MNAGLIVAALLWALATAIVVSCVRMSAKADERWAEYVLLDEEDGL